MIILGTGTNTFVNGGGQNTFEAADGAAVPSALDQSYNVSANTPLIVSAPGVLTVASDPAGSPLSAMLANAPRTAA